MTVLHAGLADAILAFERGKEESKRPEDRQLVTEYLGRLGPMLADAVAGKDLLGRLRDMEAYFGHTWVVDVEPFRDAFDAYRAFAADYERFVLSGMTVNERLAAMGLSDAADAARAGGDSGAFAELLRRCHVPEEDVLKIVQRDSSGGAP